MTTRPLQRSIWSGLPDPTGAIGTRQRLADGDPFQGNGVSAYPPDRLTRALAGSPIWVRGLRPRGSLCSLYRALRPEPALRAIWAESLQFSYGGLVSRRAVTSAGDRPTRSGDPGDPGEEQAPLQPWSRLRIDNHSYLQLG